MNLEVSIDPMVQSILKRTTASANQRRYVKAELSGIGTYMISMGHAVEGPFNSDQFRAAATSLVARHDALRTHFSIAGGEVTALISAAAAPLVHTIEMADSSLDAFRDWAIPLIFADVNPTAPNSLIRFFAADYGNSWRFTIAGHHAVTDGVSRGVMNKELLKLYAGEDLAPAQSYYDFATTTALAEDQLAETDVTVGALPKPVRIIGDAVGDDAAETGQFVECDFGPLQRDVTRAAKAVGSSKFAFLSGIYALGLRGYAGDNQISSYFQSAGRGSLNAPNSVVGSFSNTLALNLTVDPEQPFGDFAAKLKAQTTDIVALENGPLLDRIIETGKAPSVSMNMFPPEAPIRAGDLRVGPREFLDRRTEFDLNLVWSEDRKSLKARVFFNAARISEERANLFLGFQARLLNAALAAPETSCRDLIHHARRGFEADTPVKTSEPAPNRRLHAAFFDWAQKTPHAPALVMTQDTWSYQTLADRALCIATGLQSAGVRPKDRVTIYAQRGPEMVAAMLGCSAYGASFCLADATYPTARIALMMETAGSTHVIEAGATLPSELMHGVKKIVPARTPQFDVSEAAPRDEAFVLFTSGTTGRPKMVSHPDRAPMRFFAWQAETIDPDGPIVTTMMAGLAHDPTIRDVFLPLNRGGSVAVPTAKEMAEPCNLRALIRRAGCNILRLSTSSGRLLATGIGDDERFPTLAGIFWGGERLPRKTVDRWCALSPHARQFNVFGTTETPQAFLIQPVAEVPNGADLPIGSTLPWTGAKLVDEDGTPVSVGEVGELVATLSDRVVGMKHPHATLAATEPNTHYTGDLGFQMSDGAIRYAGRRDNQISINGYRVELGEIETTVEAMTGIQRAAAIFADNRLRLFVIGEADNVTEADVRASLSLAVPSYMVPQQILILDHFPYTPNGKIDTEALLALGDEPKGEGPQARDWNAPVGADENMIADIFARYTGQAGVAREHSLADLGADSLATIEVRLALEKSGLTLPDRWAWMAVADLAADCRALAPQSAPNNFFSRMARTEMFVVLRCLAILAVVLHHSGFPVTNGASIMLFVLAGYSFTQMQLPGIINEDNAGRVWALQLRLLVPLVPVTLIYLIFNLRIGVETDPSSVFFYRNFFNLLNVMVLDQPGQRTSLIWLWFIHAYLQMFLIVGLLLCSAWTRQAIAADMWRSMVVFFAACEVVNILALGAVTSQVGDRLIATDLLSTTPFVLMPFMALGAVVAAAKTRQQVLLSFGLVLAHFAFMQAVEPVHGEIWWVVALVLCTVSPFARLPQVLLKPVMLIAAYSLMIYLTHSLFLDTIKWVLGHSNQVLIFSIFVQVIGGVLLGIAFKPVIDHFRLQRVTTRQPQRA